MTDVFITLGEEATNLLVDVLLQIGYTIRGDGCECVYVEVFGLVRLVIQLFA